ncbi:MAG: hypothetical protein Q9163_003273 [Psora crenata]
MALHGTRPARSARKHDAETRDDEGGDYAGGIPAPGPAEGEEGAGRAREEADGGAQIEVEGDKSEGGGGGGRVGRATISQASGLLSLAERKLGMGEIEEASRCARKALKSLQRGCGEGLMGTAALPAVHLLAEIEIERGDLDAARRLFEEAVVLDPEGRIPEAAGGGAEKFLWLAQLSEQGGKESLRWFKRGAEVLRDDIARLGEHVGPAGQEKRKKLSGALCGMVEVYMTDLSWEEDAEATCERLIAEAMMVAPESAETWQTLASVRISQVRTAEAREALGKSMELWKNVGPEASSSVPDFPTRVSLARLLMEVELQEEALEVVERLVSEEDQSVEAWYLGGWCLYLLAQKSSENGHVNRTANEYESFQKEQKAALLSSHEWLKQSLSLYNLLEYEDERLRDHARELIEELDERLGGESINNEEDVAEEWQSEEEDEDHEMEGT